MIKNKISMIMENYDEDHKNSNDIFKKEINKEFILMMIFNQVNEEMTKELSNINKFVDSSDRIEKVSNSIIDIYVPKEYMQEFKLKYHIFIKGCINIASKTVPKGRKIYKDVDFF